MGKLEGIDIFWDLNFEKMASGSKSSNLTDQAPSSVYADFKITGDLFLQTQTLFSYRDKTLGVSNVLLNHAPWLKSH